MSGTFIVVNVALGILIIFAAILTYQQNAQRRARQVAGQPIANRTRNRIILGCVAVVLLAIVILILLTTR